MIPSGNNPSDGSTASASNIPTAGQEPGTGRTSDSKSATRRARPTPEILHSKSVSAVEEHAVRELRRLLKSIFGLESESRGLVVGETPLVIGSKPIFTLLRTGGDEATDRLLAKLGYSGLDEQEYLIERMADSESPALLLAGGSSASLLWAVYELAEFWGVRFLLGQDVLPDRTGEQPDFPQKPIRRTPVFPLRVWRGMNVLPHSGAYWGKEDYCQLIDQLAKLRFNGFYIYFRPFDPFLDFEWEGTKKSTGALSFGWRFPIVNETIGRDKFEGAQWYENPDIPYEGTYKEKFSAAKKLVSAISQRAAARGIALGLAIWFNEVAPEFKERLRELSIQDGFDAKPAEGGHLDRLGIWREGKDPRFMPYMSARNPRFVDLLEAQLLAYFKQYPEASFFVLSHSEFASSDSDSSFVWESLSQRHNLGSEDQLRQLIDKAVKNSAGDYIPIAPGRLEAQIRSNISMLYILDEILNRRGTVRKYLKPGTPLIINLCDELGPLAAKILGPGIGLMSALSGYLASDSARRAHSLDRYSCGDTDTHIILSFEDDNIGICPQFTAPSLHTIMAAAAENGIKGLWGRQWLLSKIEPAVTYVSHACWDSALTPKAAYEHLVRPICGESAVGAVLNAFEFAEKLTLQNDRVFTPHSFLVPMLLLHRWQDNQPLSEEMLASRDMFQELIDKLRLARSNSKEQGHDFIDQFIHQATFAKNWLTVMDKVQTASQANRDSSVALKKGHIDEFDRRLQESVHLLDEAISVSKEAILAWTEAVRDRADLGALAALNYFGHQFLTSIRHVQYLRSSYWAVNLGVKEVEDELS